MPKMETNNEALYKKMYVIPESQYHAENPNFPSPKTSLRDLAKQPKKETLKIVKKPSKKKTLNDAPCHTCKKPLQSNENELDLHKTFKSPAIKPKRKKKQAAIVGKRGKEKNLNKEAAVKKKTHGKRKLDLTTISTGQFNKFKTGLQSQDLKFKSKTDYRRLLNAIFKFAKKKSTHKVDKISALEEIKKLRDEIINKSQKNGSERDQELLEEYEERVEYLETLISDLPYSAVDYVSDKVQFDDPNSMLVGQLYDEFLQGMAQNSHLVNKALAARQSMKPTSVARRLSFRDTPSATPPRQLHSKIVDPGKSESKKSSKKKKIKKEPDASVTFDHTSPSTSAAADAASKAQKEAQSSKSKKKKRKNPRHPDSSSPAKTRGVQINVPDAFKPTRNLART